ncbi:hypothetical protein D3C78_1919130 [compost metagenome]
MPVAQGGQAIGAVVPGVLGIADTDQRRVEQGDDRGHDLVAAETRRRQQGFQLFAQLRQGQAEIPQA